MGVTVSFNYALWVQQFPEFAYLTEPQATIYFDMATTLCRNDGSGPVTKESTQTLLLNMLTAHFAKLNAPLPSGAPPGGLVGRITSATEGSVSVSTEFPMNPNNAWFMQTMYGATYWQLTAPYRTMRYRPGPRRNFNPIYW